MNINISGDRATIIQEVQEFFVYKNASGILNKDLKNDLIEPATLLLSIGYALGFRNLKVDESNTEIKISGINLDNEEQIIFNLSLSNLEITGMHASVAKKVYALIYSIENELSEAIYLPQDLRKEIISNVCQRIKVDSSLYSHVLKNWHK